MIAYTDILLEGGILFLLAFTPLVYGTIPVWAVAVFRVVGVGLFAVWLLRHALARTPLRWRLDGLTALVVAYLGINLASLAVSVNLDDSQEEVANLLAYLAVFFLTAQIIRTPRQALRCCGVQVAVAVLLSVYSVLQHYGVEFIAWNPPAGKRSFATFGNPNRLAGYLIMVTPLLMMAGIVASSWRVRMAALASTVLVYAGLVFTYSRGGWLALVVALGGFGVVVALLFRQRLALTRRSLVVLVAVVAALAAITVAQRGTRLLREMRFLNPANFSVGRIDLGVRGAMWEGTVNIIAGHPWLGTGIGTYRTAIYKAEPEDLQKQLVFKRETPTYSHNDYLQTASEIGLPGLAVFIVLLFFSLPGLDGFSGGIRSRPCGTWSWEWRRA